MRREQKQPGQVHRSGAELIEHLGQAERELGHAVALERGVLGIAQAFDAVAVERGDGEVQVESPALHFDQVLDHVSHGMAFGLDERGQTRHELGVGQGAER